MKKQMYTVPEGFKITSVDFEKGVVIFEREELKFKRGDFVVREETSIHSYSIGIYCEGEKWLWIYNNRFNKPNGYIANTPDRLATPEEKQLLLDKMHEAGKDWDEEKCEVIDYVWKPKEGEIFRYITSGGMATDRYSETYHSNLIKLNNCFKTSELAQIAWDKVKEVLKEVKHF